tara:strand:+ start:172 stop:627 length:456 start_codon:yes stop_codon:yes gene_type:complete
MKDSLLNLIPDDILNLIWLNVAQDVKYSLNKQYFEKFYFSRFNSILFNQNRHYKYKYIHFVIKNDLNKIFEKLLYLYFKKIKSPSYNIFYNNLKFNNIFDFMNYYIHQTNINRNINRNKIIFNDFIKTYKLSHLLKKTHKNNANKNIKWKN